MPISSPYDPGSFRDRDGRIFYDQSGRIYRALSQKALNDWTIVRETQFLQAAIRNGQVVHTVDVRDDSAAGTGGRQNERDDTSVCDSHTFPASRKIISNEILERDKWAGIVGHETIPFITYPYEWSFGMLRDAALLHLQLLDQALDENVTLKDGTAYNVQFQGIDPIFIDTASFEQFVPGKPWAGYRQFCQTFLYPLFLQAYKNVHFHPWLRGCLNGISAQDCRNLMSFRDLFRPGVAAHVAMHAWLQTRRQVEEMDTSTALQSAGFGKELIKANVRGLKKLLSKLKWRTRASVWSDYDAQHSYSSSDQLLKENFVRQCVSLNHSKCVWDIGCNTGTYSRIAAENADLVVAMDSDHLAVEKLYQSLKSNPLPKPQQILPIVTNLADPSGGQGWRNTERKSLVDRGHPDLTLCLALIHHLVLGNGIPLHELVNWFTELGTNLVIEFVTKDDPMVKRLLRGRHDNYSDYNPTVFENSLRQSFDLHSTLTLNAGTRILYFALSRKLP